MVVAMAGMVLLVGIASVAARQHEPSATRNFNPASVAPGGTGDGDHPGRQLRGLWRGDRDAARRVRLRIQHPRLGGSECERPGGPVHAARGFLRRLHGHRLQDGGVPLLLGYAQGLRPGQPHGRRRRHRDGGGSQHSDSQRHPVLRQGIGGPWRAGDGHHPGGQLRGHWTGDGDAARRVRLRIQHPRLGGSECERPGGPVHAARGFLRRLHGHRLQDGGAPLLLGYAQGLRPGQPHGRRRRHRDGDRSAALRLPAPPGTSTRRRWPLAER